MPKSVARGPAIEVRFERMLNARNIPTATRDDRPQQSLRTDDLDYDLPERLIATRPIPGARDSARMMVISRSDPDRIEHRIVRDLPEFLGPNDALVFNTSAVVRARLAGHRSGTGGRVEGLFLSEATDANKSTSPQVHRSTVSGNAFGSEDSSPSLWLVMLRSNGRLRIGDRIELVDAHDEPAGVALELRERSPEGGEWIVAVDPPVAPGGSIELLERIGRTPLPPYILRARGGEAVEDKCDRAWYETVYADPASDRRRSVAAPTAGLHFTPELLARLDQRGVKRLEIVLHVGPGTFKPVTVETLAEHVMHSEWYEVPPATLEFLAAKGDARIIAIGTTAVRTLESLPDTPPATNEPLSGATDLLIAPGHSFRHVDGLLTNFHLPRSTLLALVAAFIGLDRVKALYREAIEREYRFYSYGDCMLILP